MPVLMYEAQTCSFTQLNTLRTTQTAMERNILNIKKSENSKWGNEKKTEVVDIVYKVKRLNLNMLAIRLEP